MDLGLEGRKAIITGGTRGIGHTIARTLLDEGVDVAICARSGTAVAEAIDELSTHAGGATVTGAAVDVGDRVAYRAWLEAAADELGGVDIFIGNVAYTPDADEDTRWQAAFDIDLGHCVVGCRTLLPHLAQSDAGAVVLISSVAAVMAELPEGEGPYGAMKAALVSYAAQLAHRAAQTGTRVNTVLPGPTVFEGGVWDQIRRDDPDTFAAAEAMTALGRLATPEEIARVVVFLAGPAASYVTGANWRVDGGILKHANF
jgi:NAD(P)-dependent dehydrogenase (short-subunit alcohol dehydrogenase family)